MSFSSSWYSTKPTKNRWRWSLPICIEVPAGLRQALGGLLLCSLPGSGSAATQQVNPDTGLRSWKVGGQAFSIELIQVLPDYVRAVYAARGLPQKIIDDVSSYCVFGTIIRNTTAEPLSYRVADWRYITPDGTRHRLKTKSEWVQEWRDMGVAFRWSMLADEQTFAEGDWVRGERQMIGVDADDGVERDSDGEGTAVERTRLVERRVVERVINCERVSR